MQISNLFANRRLTVLISIIFVGLALLIYLWKYGSHTHDSGCGCGHTHEDFQSSEGPSYLSSQVLKHIEPHDPQEVEKKIRDKYQSPETVSDLMNYNIQPDQLKDLETVGNNQCQWFVPPDRHPHCPLNQGLKGCQETMTGALYYFNAYNRNKGFVPEADFIRMKESDISYKMGTADDGYGGLRSGSCIYNVTPQRIEKYPSPTGDMLSKVVDLEKTRLVMKLTEAQTL